ncbi:MAG TPA: L,D-transpeptidase [Candidatus Saccharimonadales bacterium]|nr:L,D-transpeptidase [Candidatus Saccharimonadales bacterium]
MGQQKQPIHSAPLHARTKHVSVQRSMKIVVAAETPESTSVLQHRPWHRFILGGSFILLTVVLTWVFGNVFLTRVSLAGASISEHAPLAKLTQAIHTQTSAYKLTINYSGEQSKTFSLTDMGVTIDAAQSARAIKNSQTQVKHMLEWWEPQAFALKTHVNSVQFRHFLATNISGKQQAPTDANLNISDGKASITPDKPSITYSLASASQSILTAIAYLQNQQLRISGQTLPAKITADSLKPALSQAQTVLSQHIAVHIGGKTTTLSASDIGKWLTVNAADPQQILGVNTDALSDYINNLAKNAGQPARSQVILSGGKVAQAGQPGIAVGNIGDALNTLANNLLAGKGIDTTLPTQTAAYKTITEPTTGKWIEVNTATKHMYAYDQSQLVRSFAVSAGATATPTVTGQFAIYSKYISQNMYGENPNGSSYYQPNVPYVNYFYRDFAIHGNYWRPTSYFGNINSSHGCVGLPVGDSAWVYNWAPIGTPVVVHT